MKLKTNLLFATTCLIVASSALAEHPGLLDATALDGTDVWDFHGKKLGDVKHILIDPQNGRVRCAVIEVDKAWEIVDPEIAVPWGALRVTRKADKTLEVALDSTKERLGGAPRYKSGDGDRILSPNGGATIYNYWRAQWSDDPVTSGTTVPPTPGAETPPTKPGLPRNTDSEPNRPRP